MRSKAFALTKEQISSGRPAATMAVASALVRDIGLARDPTTGRDGEAAARRAALVSLGKKSILYRFASAQNERSGAIEELVWILRSEGRKFQHPWVEVIAATALHELAFDKCETCFGRGEVRDHSVEALEGPQPMRICGKCNGQRRRKFDEDARVQVMAREFVATTKIKHESDAELNEHIALTAKTLRKSRQLRDMQHVVDFAKHVLIDAERASVEGAAAALERMRPGE